MAKKLQKLKQQIGVIAMRKNIYQLLEEMGCDPKTEYSRLYELIFIRKYSYVRHYTNYTTILSVYIDQYCFEKISLHGSFSYLADMMSSLHLTDDENTFDKLFLLCELMFGIWEEGSSFIKDEYMRERMSIIIENIKFILGKTNHELIKDPSNRSIIIEKSKAATQAAEIVENSETAFKILEYNHYGLKGKLQEKRAILSSIGQYIEPMLQDKTFLAKDAGFLLNNFHIRHNNSKNPFIESISDETLEEWYDKTYNTLLAVIIANEQIKISSEIKEIKAKHFAGSGKLDNIS